MHSSRSRFELQLGGSGRDRGADDRNERSLADESERKNPLGAPRVLLDAADSSIVDQLEIVIRRVEQLPDDIQASTLRNGKYFEAYRLEDLRSFRSGLLNVHNGQVPTLDELSVIACTTEMLRELAEGFNDAAECEVMSFQHAQLLRDEIAATLVKISQRYLPSPDHLLAEDWVDEIQDRHYGPGPDGPA